MPAADFAVLDTPTISMNSFYPRKGWTPTPTGAEDLAITVADGKTLSGRFFPAGTGQPTVLFFYGNGETAPDYDNIAPIYNQVGVNFLVADYRGYGRSEGWPSFTTMLSDSRDVLDYATALLEERGYADRLFVMGRSMGRHSAFELGANRADRLQGVIIESGRPILGNFTYGLEPAVAQALEAEYLDKVNSISIPALVIHGELDTLAPVDQAISMFEGFPSPEKRLLTIPGAGHNDLLYQGINEYFTAIKEFVSS
jgi:pimeloyl-ACP methyl ester carboxylesterase